MPPDRENTAESRAQLLVAILDNVALARRMSSGAKTFLWTSWRTGLHGAARQW
jgi:hypothetical protein